MFCTEKCKTKGEIVSYFLAFLFSFLRDFFGLSEVVLLSQLGSLDNHGIEDCSAKVTKPHVRSVKDIHEDRRIQQ